MAGAHLFRSLRPSLLKQADTGSKRIKNTLNSCHSGRALHPSFLIIDHNLNVSLNLPPNPVSRKKINPPARAFPLHHANDPRAVRMDDQTAMIPVAQWPTESPPVERCQGKAIPSDVESTKADTTTERAVEIANCWLVPVAHTKSVKSRARRWRDKPQRGEKDKPDCHCRALLFPPPS